jgi:predicted transposase/invertase (TIGR01784 family)
MRGKRKIDYTLLPIYMVSLTNFGMPHGSEAVLEDGLVSRYSIRDDVKGELMTDALHFVYFEIGRLRWRIGEESRCTSRLEKLACAIRYMAEYKEVPTALRDEILVERMFEASTIANMTVKQRKYYDKSIMETWIDRQAQMDFAVNKAMKQGLEQGAARRNLEIARAMLKDHVDIKTVAKYSGISEEELQTLSSQEFLNK